MTDLSVLRGQVVLPPYLEPGSRETQAAAHAEPGLAAQQAFVAGRIAWREGQVEAALEHLQLALRLAPREPELLRLIGQVEAGRGQRMRAAEYFRQVMTLEPTDPETALFLGRFAAEQQHFNEALACYLHVESLLRAPDRTTAASGRLDPALRPLLHFHLAQALRHEGYLAQALQQYQTYLQVPRDAMGGTPLARELAFLDRQAAAATYQALGDLYLQLDQPEPARDCYQRVATLAGRMTYALVGRQIYADLRLGEVETAQQRAVAWIASAPTEPMALELIDYLVAQGLSPRMLAGELERVYRAQDQPAPLAIALAGLLPLAEGQTLLEDHLAARPHDRAVYAAVARLILGQPRSWAEATDEPDVHEPAAVLGGERPGEPLNGDFQEAGEPTSEQWERLIAVTLGHMAAAPDEAVATATLFFRFVRDPIALQPLFDLPPAAPWQASADWQMLRGMLLAMIDLRVEAAGAFERALALDPQRAEARIRLAGLALAAGQIAPARQWLEPLADQDDGRVLLMRVRMLVAEKRQAEALERLDRALAIDPARAGTGLHLEKAQLQLNLGDPVAAEKTLLTLLETRPQEEAIYAALFGIYDQQPQMIENYKRLMNHMLRLIPESRIALLKRAELLEAGGQLDQALPLLDRLLERHPRDLAALRLKLVGLHRAGRSVEMLALMDRTLASGPEDARLLQFFHEFAQRTGHHDQALAYLLRLVEGRPAGFERSRSLAAIHYQRGAFTEVLTEVERALAQDDWQEPVVFLHLQWRSLERLGRGEEAEACLKAGIERYPDHRGDLFYELSVLLHRQGRRAEAEVATEAVLAANPAHGPANNALAYAWAQRGERLEEARAMVLRALETDPDSAAYLDTKGWVLYKLGHFQDAADWLGRSLQQAEIEQQAGRDTTATRAVVQDHRGDVLYRLGRQDEALVAWEAARLLVEAGELREQIAEDPELATLMERVAAKLAAAAAGNPAPVEPVPGLAEKVEAAWSPE